MSVFTDEVTADQGAPQTPANAWPVEVTDGTNILGTSAHPVKVDPTGSTTQPVSGTVTVAQPTAGNLNATVTGSVSVSNFPVTQPVSGTVSATQGTSPWVVSGTVTTSAPASSSATITRIATSTTAVTALASNASRKKVIIATETGTTYLVYGATASATNYTMAVGANSVIEIDIWTGSISVIRSAGTGNIQVTELV